MSTNISKQKREELLAKIKAIRTFIATAEQDENTGNLLAYLSELERDVGGKKYGLVFEEHREEIDEILATHTPVLTEDGSLLIDNGGQMNFLLEGDNLASLQLLLKTHKGKIDLIYIDPPYNTGNKDFVYDDAFVDGNDTFRHSKWLSFINKRLRLAKSLLTSNGVIFISIDDNEYANLKSLCDEIFGADCFVANVIWQKKTGASDARGIAVITEYILVYAKNSDTIRETFNKNTEAFDASRYRFTDEYVARRGNYYLDSLDRGSVRYSDSLNYPIIAPDGTEIYPNGRTTFENDGWTWKWSKEKVEWGIQNGFIVISKSPSKPNGWAVRYKIYLNVDNEDNLIEKSSPFKNIINNVLNANAAADIKAIFGGKAFQYSKPVGLIETLLNYAVKKNSLILDFFAGSGTTGHAVMKLNAEDGGNRRFILCTNNENNICREVTYERIRRVIDKEGYAASLKYFKVEYVPIDSRMYYEYADELLRHIRELVELENGVNFTANAEIGIVLTEEELEEFVTSDAFALCRKLYVGHDVLPTDEQMAAIKAGGIEISVIPDYYYKDLQEG